MGPWGPPSHRQPRPAQGPAHRPESLTCPERHLSSGWKSTPGGCHPAGHTAVRTAAGPGRTQSRGRGVSAQRGLFAERVTETGSGAAARRVTAVESGLRRVPLGLAGRRTRSARWEGAPSASSPSPAGPRAARALLPLAEAAPRETGRFRVTPPTAPLRLSSGTLRFVPVGGHSRFNRRELLPGPCGGGGAGEGKSFPARPGCAGTVRVWRPAPPDCFLRNHKASGSPAPPPREQLPAPQPKDVAERYPCAGSPPRTWNLMRDADSLAKGRKCAGSRRGSG